MFFTDKIFHVLDRLYSHDAIEAMYDFENIDLGDWSDTPANRLDKHVEKLQLVITKLEGRYQLQYRLSINYDSGQQLLTLNTVPIFSCGASTLRHKLLSALYSDPHRLWLNEDLEEYFIKCHSYTVGQLKDATVEKAANDIKRDVAAKVSVKDHLIISNSSVRINPIYLNT